LVKKGAKPSCNSAEKFKSGTGAKTTGKKDGTKNQVSLVHKIREERNTKTTGKGCGQGEEKDGLEGGIKKGLREKKNGGFV